MLLDPLGRAVTSEKREIVTNNPEHARFAERADGVFREFGLTVVCLQCGGTPKMANHKGDALWKMECACSVRVLRNHNAKGH